jgi:hypothetical protein
VRRLKKRRLVSCDTTAPPPEVALFPSPPRSNQIGNDPAITKAFFPKNSLQRSGFIVGHEDSPRAALHNDHYADSLPPLLKINTSIVKRHANCRYVFRCGQPHVAFEIANRFKRQAGRVTKAVLTPA